MREQASQTNAAVALYRTNLPRGGKPSNKENNNKLAVGLRASILKIANRDHGYFEAPRLHQIATTKIPRTRTSAPNWAKRRELNASTHPKMFPVYGSAPGEGAHSLFPLLADKTRGGGERAKVAPSPPSGCTIANQFPPPDFSRCADQSGGSRSEGREFKSWFGGEGGGGGDVDSAHQLSGVDKNEYRSVGEVNSGRPMDRL